MSILEQIDRGYYPEALGIDDILRLVADSGHYDEFGLLALSIDIEEQAHSGKYLSIKLKKGTPSKFGLNPARKRNGKDRLDEPVISRQTVKDIFKYLGVPQFPDHTLISKWLNHEVTKTINPAGSGSESVKDNIENNKIFRREMHQWLFETWEDLGRPGGSKFFRSLKSYKAHTGNPIVDYWSSCPKPGIRWVTQYTSGELSKKSIQNMVSSKFRKIPVNPE